jgi:hypothetical protein
VSEFLVKNQDTLPLGPILAAMSTCFPVKRATFSMRHLFTDPRRLLLIGACGSLLSLANPLSALADLIEDDPLHGVCFAPSSCSDNGTDTLTSDNPPHFGFTISPGPQTGGFLIEILVPTAVDPNPSALSFHITGIQGGANNNAPLAATSTLVSATAFSKKDLATYLGLDPSSPANPIGGFRNAEYLHGDGNTTDSFYVYQVDLGINTIQRNNLALLGPILDINALPDNSIIVAFLHTADGYVATALSGQLLVDTPRVAIPEPASIALLASALAGAAVVRRRRHSA